MSVPFGNANPRLCHNKFEDITLSDRSITVRRQSTVTSAPFAVPAAYECVVHPGCRAGYDGPSSARVSQLALFLNRGRRDYFATLPSIRHAPGAPPEPAPLHGFGDGRITHMMTISGSLMPLLHTASGTTPPGRRTGGAARRSNPMETNRQAELHGE